MTWWYQAKHTQGKKDIREEVINDEASVNYSVLIGLFLALEWQKYVNK